MALKDIVNKTFAVVDKASDNIHYAKALMYYADGERYRLIKDEQTYKYFKRKCAQEYRKITNAATKNSLRSKIGDYAPKKP